MRFILNVPSPRDLGRSLPYVDRTVTFHCCRPKLRARGKAEHRSHTSSTDTSPRSQSLGRTALRGDSGPVDDNEMMNVGGNQTSRCGVDVGGALDAHRRTSHAGAGGCRP